MIYFKINIENSNLSFKCTSDQSILSAIERLGIKGIPIGCRRGGCGVCRIQILDGSISMKVMSREHISTVDEIMRQVLACRVQPTSDLIIRITGKIGIKIAKSELISKDKPLALTHE